MSSVVALHSLHMSFRLLYLALLCACFTWASFFFLNEARPIRREPGGLLHFEGKGRLPRVSKVVSEPNHASWLLQRTSEVPGAYRPFPLFDLVK